MFNVPYILVHYFRILIRQSFYILLAALIITKYFHFVDCSIKNFICFCYKWKENTTSKRWQSPSWKLKKTLSFAQFVNHWFIKIDFRLIFPFSVYSGHFAAERQQQNSCCTTFENNQKEEFPKPNCLYGNWNPKHWLRTNPFHYLPKGNFSTFISKNENN